MMTFMCFKKAVFSNNGSTLSVLLEVEVMYFNKAT